MPLDLDSIIRVTTVGDLTIHHLGLKVFVDDGERVHHGQLVSMRISPSGALRINLAGRGLVEVGLDTECAVIADA